MRVASLLSAVASELIVTIALSRPNILDERSGG